MRGDNFPAFPAIILMFALVLPGIFLGGELFGEDGVARGGGLGFLAYISFVVIAVALGRYEWIEGAGIFAFLVGLWLLAMFVGCIVWNLVLQGGSKPFSTPTMVLGGLCGTGVLVVGLLAAVRD